MVEVIICHTTSVVTRAFSSNGQQQPKKKQGLWESHCFEIRSRIHSQFRSRPLASVLQRNQGQHRSRLTSPFFFLRYHVLFYINPQFYGYAAMTKVLLGNVRLKCPYESTLNCISTDGNAVLARFGYDTVNIYEHLAVSWNRHTCNCYNFLFLYHNHNHHHHRRRQRRRPRHRHRHRHHHHHHEHQYHNHHQH